MRKAEVRTLVRNLLDDESRVIWADSTLDMLIELVLDDLWGDILDTSAYSTSQLDTFAALTSPGYIDLRTTTAGGQLSQRFYRIQNIIRNERAYNYQDTRNQLVSIGVPLITIPYTFSIYGYQCYLFDSNGFDGSGSTEIQYSYKPAKFTSLAETDTIPFIDGQESALIYASALQAMSRAPVEAKQSLMILAEQARQRLLNSIKRQYSGPMVPWASGSVIEFGGT